MSKRTIISRTPRRSVLVGASWLAFEMTYLGAGALVSACGEPSTGGRRVSIATRARGDIAKNAVVETSLGWSIEVTRARLALDTLYYVSGPPAGLVRCSDGIFSIPTAQAHPGHYDSGDVLGEFQGPVTLDLLAPEQVLGEDGGVSGLALSAVITLGSLGGDDGTLAVVLEGVAARGDTTLPFRATIERAAIDNPTSHLPEIDGCPLEAGAIKGDGTVLLEVGVAVWLDNIDFAEVSVPESGLALLEPDTPPHNAFRRGIAKAMGYRFEYSPAA